VAKVVKKSSIPTSDPRWTGEIMLHEVMAVKCLAAGNANADQQRLVIDLIVNKLGQAHLPFFSENSESNCFFMGRRFVALELAKLISLEINKT